MKPGSTKKIREMGSPHSKPEETIAKLREVEVSMGRGETAALAIRAIGVSE